MWTADYWEASSLLRTQQWKYLRHSLDRLWFTWLSHWRCWMWTRITEKLDRTIARRAHCRTEANEESNVRNNQQIGETFEDEDIVRSIKLNKYNGMDGQRMTNKIVRVLDEVLLVNWREGIRLDGNGLETLEKIGAGDQCDVGCRAKGEEWSQHVSSMFTCERPALVDLLT